MSQIELNFRRLLNKKPEIEKCYQDGLVNRRALARYLIQNNIAEQNQLEAVIAMLRRFDFTKQEKTDFEIFKKLKTKIKDNIIILNFKKTPELLVQLNKIVASTNFTISETLKVIVGTINVMIILDKNKEDELKEVLRKFELIHRFDNISEISLLFPDEVIDAKGVLALVTNELFVHDVVILEFLTANPELLIYLKEKYVLKAYEIIKDLQR